MDMEALIKKPRSVLESAHQDLSNRGGPSQKLYNYVLYFIVCKLRPGQRRAARSAVLVNINNMNINSWNNRLLLIFVSAFLDNIIYNYFYYYN